MIINSISLSQKIVSDIRYWKRFFLIQFRFARTFSNYFEIISKLLKMQFPILIKIRNAGKLQIKTYNAAYFISHISDFKNVKFDIYKDLVLISNKGKNDVDSTIKFHGGVNNGDLIHSFLKSDYSNLPILDKWVLDIGMNIGDSSIYFILNGAKKVIGVEPFPRNFEMALKNVSENNLQEKIELVMESCSSQEGKITIDTSSGGSVDDIIKETKTGFEIPLTTLEGIIKKYNIPKDSILKMDCEGCEDEIISSVTNEVINHFSNIQIEYHNGYQEIKDKLEKCGFNVHVSKPISSNVLGNLVSRFSNKPISRKKIGYVGFVYAEKRGNN